MIGEGISDVGAPEGQDVPEGQAVALEDEIVAQQGESQGHLVWQP